MRFWGIFIFNSLSLFLQALILTYGLVHLLSMSGPFGPPWAPRMGHLGKLFGVFLGRPMPLLPFWVQSGSEVVERLTFARLWDAILHHLGRILQTFLSVPAHVMRLVGGGEFLR